MSEFALNTVLPRYLRVEKERIEQSARKIGLDFFPVVFEMITYYQMNEIASFGGFPVRYPHWRFGMEYERLSKHSEYGLSRIYEMVINNNPAYGYLLEGNSLTEQRLVMAHVFAHVDFFKNNFCFRATDLDTLGRTIDPSRRPTQYNPNRRWIDKMANHGSRIARHIARYGIDEVESYVDHCLSLENLIDPWAPFTVRAPEQPEGEPDSRPEPVEVPRLAAKDYMEPYINPAEYLDAQKKRLDEEQQKKKGFPAEPQRDVLRFLIDHAPLKQWERDILSIIRTESYYFVPQMQTKIMNEGWASYWHSRLMTEHILDASEIVDYADRNASVLATLPGQLNPYKLGVALLRHIEERWNRGRFGPQWEECDNLDDKRQWDMRLGLGRERIFQVRALYNDVTFIDEFLTPDFVIDQKLYTFGYSEKNGRYEIKSRQFQEVKGKLLFQLTNFGNPDISVVDANFQNRGELLLRHEHGGIDLRQDWAKETLRALVRVWKRPVGVATVLQGKPVLLRYDGTEHSEAPYSV
ncbi:MAG: SpoVR family protein [Deltaproteobacteria bacterium]|nr:SpoVR family protein [Deltaproteobacteria bacterium]